MLKKIIITIVALCSVISNYAAPPAMTASKITVAPTIDGNLTDSCWQAAKWQTGFLKLNSQQKASPTTKFKITYNDLGLYFAISCNDTKIKTQKRARDGAIYYDDCIELFIVPYSTISADPNIREVYHFLINASGSQYDAFGVGGVENKKWNTNWKSATKKRLGGWDLELFLPFNSFNMRGNDTTWRFNIARENKGDNNELSTWSKLVHFQESKKYGYLKGINIDFTRYKRSVSQLTIKNSSIQGKITPTLSFKVSGASLKNLVAECAVYQAGNLVDFTSKTITKVNKNQAVLEMPLGKIAKSGKYLIKLLLNDDKGVVYYSEIIKKINIAPMKIAVIKPFYRNNIYSKQKDKSINIECRLAVSTAAANKYRLDFILQNSAGKIIKQQKMMSPKTINNFDFDAAKLKPGKYEVKVTLRKGTIVTCSFSEFINLLPVAKGNEIWLNPERQLVINGNKFFSNGFIGFGSNKILPILKQSGFNVIHSYSFAPYYSIDKIIKQLDELNKYGMKAIFSPYHKTRHGFWGFGDADKMVPELTDEQEQKMIAMVNKLKYHPALLGWYLFDEPRGAKHCVELKRIYKILKTIDPFHPVIGVDNDAVLLIEKGNSCDVFSLDFYPSPRINKGNTLSIYSIFASVKKVADELVSKGIWYTPQSFSRAAWHPNEDHRSPTYREIRSAEYGAILAGATGLLRYKIGDQTVKYGQPNSNSGIFHSPDMKIGFLNGMGPELKAMSNVLLSETILGQTTVTNTNIKLLTKRYRGKVFVIAVNLTPKNIGKVILKLPSLKATQIKVLFENRSVKVSANSITDKFSPFAVHIYTDAIDFKESLNINEVQNQIDKALKK